MERTQLKAVACGCRSWWCDHCCRGKGLELRQRVQWVVDNCFGSVLLVTLTINPNEFAGPLEAYKAASERISVFVDKLYRQGLLKSRRWFRVLECHESGFPHFHVLLDAAWIDYEKAWKAWNGARRTEETKRSPEWGIIDLRRASQGLSREQAVNYVCTYLTKRPKAGWPEWIVGNDERIRRYQCSVGFWSELRALHPNSTDFVTAELEAEEKPSRRRQPSNMTHAQRTATCGGKTIVREVTEYVKSDGEIVERFRFVAMFADSVDELARTLCVDLLEGGRQFVCDATSEIVEALRAGCAWRALKKFKLDKRLAAFLERHRPKKPALQGRLFEVPAQTYATAGY